MAFLRVSLIAVIATSAAMYSQAVSHGFMQPDMQPETDLDARDEDTNEYVDPSQSSLRHDSEYVDAPMVGETGYAETPPPSFHADDSNEYVEAPTNPTHHAEVPPPTYSAPEDEYVEVPTGSQR
mmetsp:Transcript_96428/g.152511  ORF Transcript_96428/g.152511 Transcript_96428/m.152511 type:complete len:124 (+) Transcript_96428:76-447(+)